MLDKIIKEQLEQLEVAKVSAYNEANHRYLFNKVGGLSLSLHKSYIIKLDKNLTILEMSSSLANNWNHGLVPTHELMQIEVLEKMGTMYRVKGYYLNEDCTKMDGCDFWEGWLPIEHISIVKEIV